MDNRSLSSQQKKFYEDEHTRQQKEMATLTSLFLANDLSPTKFHEGMLDGLKQYYIRLALVAKGGRPLTQRDKQDIGKFLALQKDYLDPFVSELTSFRARNKEVGSVSQAIARSSSYANGWGVFTRFSIPAGLADALPALPGVDCLGGMQCGCWLEWSASTTEVVVFWHINPIKEHCVLCLGFSVDWAPYVVSIDEIDPDLLDDDYEFFYG